LPPEPLPPPPGFETVSSTSPFVSRSGKYFERSRSDGSVTLGTRLQPDQVDSDGIIDRRFLLTFADFALSDVTHAITLQISVDYMGSACVGDWVEATVLIHGRSGTLIFAEAVIAGTDGRTLMRVRATLIPFVRRSRSKAAESEKN
jgi:acyl-coenzyme A thioesterase 13